MKTNNQNQVGSLHPSSTVLVSTASVALTLDALVTAGAVALVTLAFEVTAPWLKNVLETCVDVLKTCVGKNILKKCVEKCLKDVEHNSSEKKKISTCEPVPCIRDTSRTWHWLPRILAPW